MRTCLIINPTAGQKVGLTTNALGLEDAKALLERHHIEADVLCTERAGHGTELAQQAVRDGYELVIAAGGDGTVAEVAEGLVGTSVVLGVLPLGSVMNVARMLGVPRDLDAAAEVIKARRVARIDVGRATAQAKSTLFLEAAGVGADAGLFAYFNQLDRGNWASLKPLIRFMWRYRPRRVTIRIDGRIHRFRAMMVSIANGPYVGAALAVAPDAYLDDNKFDVEVFTRFGKFELFRHLVAIAGGRRVYNPKVLTFRAKSVEINQLTPMMVHADSNPLGTTPARFEVVPSALSVIVGGEPDCLPALRHLPPAVEDVTPTPAHGEYCDPDGTIPDAEASNAKVAAVLATKLATDAAHAEDPAVRT
jgi:diacylglycerol kinase (ATP)